MRLYRFTDNTCEHVEKVSMDQLDLTKKTLFLFPGMEVEKPLLIDDVYPDKPHERVWEISPELAEVNCNKEKHLVRLLERGVVLTQNQGYDVSQVIVGTYDSKKQNAANLKELIKNRWDYFTEAKDFSRRLFEDKAGNPRKVDPGNITFMGWSYGSAFIQQCGNAIRKIRPRDMNKIHAITVSSIIDVEWIMGSGFPGLYMFGLNDKALPQYIQDYDKDLLHLLKITHPTELPKDEVPVLIPENRQDQVITISNMPDIVNRFRHLPKGRKGKATHASDPRFPNPDYHAPAAFIEAMRGSTYTEMVDGKPTTHDAYRHTRLFQHAAEEILSRKPGAIVGYQRQLGTPGLTVKEARELLDDKGLHVCGLPPPQEFHSQVFDPATNSYRDEITKKPGLTDWKTFVNSPPLHSSNVDTIPQSDAWIR